MENAKKFLLVDDGPINEKLKLATQNLHYVNVLPSIVSFSVLSLMCMYVWKLATLYKNVSLQNRTNLPSFGLSYDLAECPFFFSGFECL